MIVCFPNTAPSTTSAALYLSLQLTLSISQTFCPFLTHSSLTRHPSHYSAVRGQRERVCVALWSAAAGVSATGAAAHQCRTNRFFTFTLVLLLGSQINQDDCTKKPEHSIFKKLKGFVF